MSAAQRRGRGTTPRLRPFPAEITKVLDQNYDTFESTLDIESITINVTRIA